MKDKIKPTKQIDDNSTISTPGHTQISQCPKCLSLFNIGHDHKCHTGWFICSICGLDLHKRGKETIRNGIKYMSFRYKKSFKIIDKTICWECAFKIVKAFKTNDQKHT